MLNQQTIEKLNSLKLKGMAQCYQNQVGASFSGLSFDERLGLLIDYEATYRENRRLERLLKDARLKEQACVEDIDYQHSRGLNRTVMSNLISCQWISSYHSILITGPTGVGKTFIACALGHNACRQNYSTRYYRVSRLLMDINMAKGDGTYPKLLNKLAKTSLLILDDWGLAPFTHTECMSILEIIDDRVKTSSMIVSGQLPVEEWHSIIPEPTIADAILDRLVHCSHKLYLKGDSMRKIKNSID